MDEHSILFSWQNTAYHLKILNFHIHVQYKKSKNQSTEVCVCMTLLNKKSFVDQHSQICMEEQLEG